MKSLRCGYKSKQPPKSPEDGGLWTRNLVRKSPKIGGLGAEVLNNEAEKLHRIHVNLVQQNQRIRTTWSFSIEGIFQGVMLIVEHRVG